MLTLDNIYHVYGDQPVLRGLNLTVKRGELVCLLGASGSGKSTLLRLVAGLEQPTHGDIRLDGQSIRDVPVHARGFGLMFQDFALFPHMTVAENVAFGLRMQGMKRAGQRERVRSVLELVNLTGFENRGVNQLSGGEKQRVALARSLAPEPRLLMLDEPMGSLDAGLRDRLIVELREIIRSLGLTTLYVTHDQIEAYAIADRIVLLHDGQIEQVGTPVEVYQQPRTAFVARFLGLSNIVPVQSLRPDAVETVLGTFEVSGQPDAVLLHPDGLSLEQQQPDAVALPGIVRECTFQGRVSRLVAEHDSGVMLRFTAAGAACQVGEPVTVWLDPAAVRPLEARQQKTP